MPVSTATIGTPRMPSTPPNAITSGNTIGSSQIAGRAEERAPQADRHHRHHVVRSEHRMRKAGEEASGAFAGVREGRRRDAEQQRSEDNAAHRRAASLIQCAKARKAGSSRRNSRNTRYHCSPFGTESANGATSRPAARSSSI